MMDCFIGCSLLIAVITAAIFVCKLITSDAILWKIK